MCFVVEVLLVHPRRAAGPPSNILNFVTTVIKPNCQTWPYCCLPPRRPRSIRFPVRVWSKELKLAQGYRIMKFKKIHLRLHLHNVQRLSN